MAVGDGVPPSSAELRRGKFNAQKKADREHCCFGADHRAYSGVLGERVDGGRLVGVSALAEPRSSLHEGRELRLSPSLPHSTRYGVGAIFTRTANLVNKLRGASAYDRQFYIGRFCPLRCYDRRRASAELSIWWR